MMIDSQAKTLKAIGTGLKKSPRHHATTDVFFDGDETEFLRAIEDFKGATGKKFPTFTDCLNVLKSLGYSKIRWKADEPVEVVLAG